VTVARTGAAMEPVKSPPPGAQAALH